MLHLHCYSPPPEQCLVSPKTGRLGASKPNFPGNFSFIHARRLMKMALVRLRGPGNLKSLPAQSGRP